MRVDGYRIGRYVVHALAVLFPLSATVLFVHAWWCKWPTPPAAAAWPLFYIGLYVMWQRSCVQYRNLCREWEADCDRWRRMCLRYFRLMARGAQVYRD